MTRRSKSAEGIKRTKMLIARLKEQGQELIQNSVENTSKAPESQEGQFGGQPASPKE